MNKIETKIGEIPSDWKVVPFGNLCKKSQYGINSPSGKGNTLVPILKMNNLSNGKVVLDEIAEVALTKEELSKFELQKNDLLVNRTNSYDLVGKTALFDLETKYVFASYVVRFQLRDNEIVPDFVNYYFNSSRGKYRLRVLATKGVSQANINPTILKVQFLIPVPSIPEQQKIVEILNFWDEAIRLTEQLIKAEKRRKKGLMQRLLSKKYQFPQYRNMPWQEFKLGELFKERKERGSENLPLLSITSEMGIIYRDELGRRDTSNSDKSKYLRICVGDIGYNTMRMWQGVSAVSELEGIVSPAYTICIPDRTKVDATFMGYLFKYEPIVNKFKRYSQGLVNDTLNLKFKNFAKVKVIIPGLEEQHHIASVLSQVDKKIELLNQKRDALQLQKKGLMQRLLTGKIRVKV